MAYNLKQTLNKEERLAPGHRMCAGCGATIAVRNVLRGLHDGAQGAEKCYRPFPPISTTRCAQAR